MTLGSGGGQRIGWIDVGRGMLVVSVVLLHAAGMLSEQGAANAPLLGVLIDMGAFRIPTLFLLSGVLFSVYVSRPWRLVLRNRILIFVWVLLVWLAVRRLVNAWILAEPVFGPVQLARDVVLELPQPGSHLWFIWCLLIVTLVGRLFSRWRWVLVVLFVVAIAGVLPGARSGLLLEELYELGSFFLLGLVLAPLVIKHSHRIGLVTTVLAVAALVVVVVLVQRPGLLGGRLPPGVENLLVAVPAVPAVIGVSRAVAALPGSSALKFIGQRTLSVYAMHFTLSMVAVRLLAARAPGVVEELPNVASVALAVLGVAGPLLVGAALKAADVHGVFDVPRWVLRCFDAVWPGRPRRPAGGGASEEQPADGAVSPSASPSSSEPGSVVAAGASSR